MFRKYSKLPKDEVNHLKVRLASAETAKRELIEAIRLTQEYTSLPALEGWTWYDVLRKHDPDLAFYLKKQWEAKSATKRTHG